MLVVTEINLVLYWYICGNITVTEHCF